MFEKGARYYFHFVNMFDFGIWIIVVICNLD